MRDLLLARARKHLRDYFTRDPKSPMAWWLEGAATEAWSNAQELGAVPTWEALMREERARFESEPRAEGEVISIRRGA